MKLLIPDMSCGHCSAAITRALQSLDAQTKVTFDMPARRAEITTSASTADVIASLDKIGFPATLA